MVASKALGEAERWFVRLSLTLAEVGAPVEAAIRRGSGLNGLGYGPLTVHRLPYRTTWDPVFRGAVTRLIREVRPEVVHTYMGRATRLARPPPAVGRSISPISVATPISVRFDMPTAGSEPPNDSATGWSRTGCRPTVSTTSTTSQN